MRPSEIVLFRHGEENPDPIDPDLSIKGRERAERLAAYLPAKFGMPDLLVAAAANRSSIRCYLTLRPLGVSTGMRIWTQLQASQAVRLADTLFSNASVREKRVFVCWTHKHLPALAKALGGRLGDYPDPWGESTFDLVLHLQYRARRRVRIVGVTQPF